MGTGAIGSQPSMDALCFGQISHPFLNSVAFYEFLMNIPFSDCERAFERGHLPLPFDSPIVFTHSDLNFSNVLITPCSSNEALCILAIIDWEQSGWMPSFWECSKQMFWTIWDPKNDMLSRHLEISGGVPEDVFMAFATYMQAHSGLM